MRPVSVRFCCFGPYMAEQFIDFSALEAGGLFLICGETGAGKTTILDAICYALYGKSSGALRGDFSVMRCKLAEKEDETLVEFVFDSNGKRYKFIRTLKYGRKNLNDTHNCLILEGDTYVPIFENPKATVVNKKAEELIGLTYEQFRQVIILPQGQFEKLLVSNSEEKEKILVSLFHADRWQRITDELYRRVAARDDALREEKKQITLKLAEYGAESIARLEEQEMALRENLAALREEEKALQQTLNARKTQQEQALLENQKFEVLEKLKQEQTALQSRDAFFEKEAEVLASADSAERIRKPFRDQQEARTRLLRAREQESRKSASKARAQTQLEQTQSQFRLHEAERPHQEERTRKLTLLENAREVYRTLEARKRSAQQAAKALAEAEAGKQAGERQFRQAEDGLQLAVRMQEQAYRAYQQANQAYLKGIGSVLAQQLKEGEPCPVCGSREHPVPAQKAAGHITEQQLEDLTRKMNESNDAVTAARSKRTRMEKARNAAMEAFSQAVQAEAAARKDYENAQTQTMPGIENTRQLEDTIAGLTAMTAAFRKKDTALAEALQKARAALTAAEAELRTAGEECAAAETIWTSAQAVWQEALRNADFASEAQFLECDLLPEDKQRRMAGLLRHRAEKERNQSQLEAQQALLEGKAPPELAAIRQALRENEASWKNLTGQIVLAENRLARLEADRKRLSGRIKAHDAAREKTDLDLDFANRLRGRSGVSLQRYVLGVMLNAITMQANRLLEGVYGGRYRLYRTDETAGSARKSGLELEVLDNQNHQRRSVTTLSGGEKFLVALSLAIGLSTVVQAQGSGIRLEAMFIDEGFGSLDRDAVYDALEVLQSIGGKAGLVGIISHVDALAEAIPAKIQIQKGKHGSKCVIHS